MHKSITAILITIAIITSNLMTTWAGTIDTTTQKPAKYYYAVAFKFYDKDLQRRYQVTHDNAYELAGKDKGRRFVVSWQDENGRMIDARVAGILDTDNPEIKTVVLMWGWSGKHTDNWIFDEECFAQTPPSIKRENEEMTPASCENGRWVWGQSIEPSHAFQITEADWNYCFGE